MFAKTANEIAKKIKLDTLSDKEVSFVKHMMTRVAQPTYGQEVWLKAIQLRQEKEQSPPDGSMAPELAREMAVTVPLDRLRPKEKDFVLKMQTTVRPASPKQAIWLRNIATRGPSGRTRRGFYPNLGFMCSDYDGSYDSQFGGSCFDNGGGDWG